MTTRGLAIWLYGFALAVRGIAQAPITNVYYVALGGSATPPYSSWATAATDIQSAVDLASAAFKPPEVDCVVLVTNGTYVLNGSIVITDGITVRSVNGPAATVVDGNYPTATNRCFFITGDAVIEGFTITNGYAYPFGDTAVLTNRGGGVYLHECKAILRNCRIFGNRAGTAAQGGDGGGVAIVGGAAQVQDCMVAGNSTMGSGGVVQRGTGIFIDGGLSTVIGCTVSNNAQGGNNGSGAGLYIANGSGVLVSNCVFLLNSSSRYGGGAYFFGGTLTHCLFSNNYARSTAGGAYPYGLTTGSRLLYSEVVDNRSGESGGGIAINRGIVSHCLVARNHAAVSGGGILNSEGTVINCRISENTAGSRGGGLYRENKNYTVEGCTIVRNYAGLEGGGVYNLAPNQLFTNNIVFWNYATNGVRNDVTGNLTAFVYSCALELADGANGNLTNDPVFMDAGSGYGTNAVAGDYRLQAHSPCVDAGTNRPWMAWPARDLGGEFRIRPFGGRVDMGAYEAYSAAGPLAVGIQAWPVTGAAPLQVMFYGETSGETNGLLWKWDFGDGTASGWEANGATSHVYEARTNAYTVTAWVTNAMGEAAVTVRTNWVMVWPEIVFVSLAGLHQAPFTNWTDAATNIQSAIDAAGGGYSTVLVAPGEYSVTNIVLNKGIILKSASGHPADTILRGRSPAISSRVVSITAAGAWLEGFTITNGNSGTANGGGVSMTAAGVITNCVLVGNRCTSGRGGGLEITAGVVVDCTIISNEVAGTLGGGGLYLFGANAVARRCYVVSNRAVNVHGGGVRIDSGTMEHSVIGWNQAGLAGGGILKTGTVTGVFRNCLILGNEAGLTGGGVQVGQGTLVLENCTLVGNRATDGGGVFGAVAATAGTNCIVVFNQATNPAGSGDLAGTATNFVYSCSLALPHGSNGNMAVDPQFVRVGQGFGLLHVAGDYRLRMGSSCVDAGTFLPWMLGGTDLAGLPRILNGAPDLGVYEGAVPVLRRGTMIWIR